ncbi:hypothetical protein EW146_g3127 [Bondarzewia mesenterica]|uniref:Serine/threonine specific protein phosphatases domain-containing protein n=1 Tax=Bondarzewia mesenterica TaxID=1095465 RepID=A0A4S4LYT3_9AGAM|nr:hypothetical protein EW146_g3127 [Bondarzewia mesenterica]
MARYDPDKWIAQLMNCEHLPEADMRVLCDRVRTLLLEESNIQPVQSPVTICGDIHGQFWDLLELLRRGGSVEEGTSYIFMAHLMWSDPDDVENWAVSPRGAGWLFGGSVTHEFNHVNSLTLIARAHQLVQEGYKYMFDDQLATVWSAPNYCYRCGNMASILTIREDGKREFTVYGPAEENERDVGMQRTRRAGNMPYFV